jgi:hypothetical protein
MITFADVNDVTSTAATLGQLKGMGAALGQFERVQPEAASTTTKLATVTRLSTDSLLTELNKVSADTASVAADANATAKRLQSIGQGDAGAPAGTPGTFVIGQGGTPAGTPVPAPPPPLETFTPQGEIDTLVEVTPIPPADVPVYKKAWFWAVVGGGVVVLGTGGYFLLRKKRA